MATSVQRAPGFFAADADAALRQRAAWFEGLGDGALFDSDDLSGASSEGCGEDDDAPDLAGVIVNVIGDGRAASPEDSNAKNGLPKEGSVLGLCAAATSSAGVEYDALDFGRAREAFARAEFIEDGAGMGGSVSSNANARGSQTLQRPEPPSRRLGRLRGEIGALCSWAAEHNAGSGSDEAELLGRKARELAQTMHKVAPAGSAATGVLGLPQGVWLPPPSEGAEVSTARWLLELERSSADGASAAQKASSSSGAGKASYQLMTSGSGWLMAAQAEALQGLQARLQGLQKLLGEPEESRDGASTASLAASTTELNRRLATLERIWDSDSCERLHVSVKLLSADIDLAAAEVNRLEAIDSEEELEAQELLSPPSSPKAGGPAEDSSLSTEEQVTRLFEQLAGASALAERVSDLQRELGSAQRNSADAQRFAEDLAGAEANAARACELLKATALAASKMRESST
ncbi:unnamed protein product, partial [Polarella glacialis]